MLMLSRETDVIKATHSQRGHFEPEGRRPLLAKFETCNIDYHEVIALLSLGTVCILSSVYQVIWSRISRFGMILRSYSVVAVEAESLNVPKSRRPCATLPRPQSRCHYFLFPTVDLEKQPRVALLEITRRPSYVLRDSSDRCALDQSKRQERA